MNFVFLGLPGTGKGTQAVLIAKEFDIPHIATGDLFRKAIKEGTKLGRETKAYLDSGSLVPDEVTLAIIEERLGEADTKKGFILDGFPRTVVQAEGLTKILKETGQDLDKVICFDVAEDQLIKRLTGRRVCSQCGANYHIEYKKPRVEGICDECASQLSQRPDDQEETVMKRLQVNRDFTKQLMDYYRQFNLLEIIDASLEPAIVTKSLLKALGGFR